MKIWIPTIVYLAIQSITPGPNNLTCLYLGGTHGIRGTGKFLTASMLSLFVKSFLCGALNLALNSIIPTVFGWIKWIGAAYLLYLAWKIGKSGWESEHEEEISKETASYKDGVILQIFNAKSWIASVSAFAVYVIPISPKLSAVFWISLVFVFLAFVSSLIWALCGSTLKKLIAKYRKPFGTIMGFSLVYCAVSAIL